MKQKTNSEELTFDDWLGAATMGSCFLTAWHYKQSKDKNNYIKEIMRRVRICRERWLNNEDPTETYFANQFPFGQIIQQFK